VPPLLLQGSYESRYEAARAAASRESTNLEGDGAWSFLTTLSRYTSSCSKANAAAAVRDETPSFAKMFCT
jgi:hypothetical protein